MFVMRLNTFQSIRNLRNCGNVISDVSCGSFAEGGFTVLVQSAFGICSAGGKYFLACRRMARISPRTGYTKLP